MTTKEVIENYENMFLKVWSVFAVNKTLKCREYCVLILNKFSGNEYYLEAKTLQQLLEELNRESEVIEKCAEEFARKMDFCIRKGFIKIP